MSSEISSVCFLCVGIPFPKTFLPTCKKVLTRLFRVFVHVYIHHFEKLVEKGAVSTKFYFSVKPAHLTKSSKIGKAPPQGLQKINNSGGAYIHIFVFTVCKNNQFQKKLMHNMNM